MPSKPFDAEDNLYRVVESILRGDRQSQELLDAGADALKRLKARSGEPITPEFEVDG